MAKVKQDHGSGVDAMAFDLLADAFLDVTGVLMRIDPEATRDLLRLIEERMVASLDNTARTRGASAEDAQTRAIAVWKAGTTIRAAGSALSGKTSIQ
ncbi:hypothetical protein Q8W71_27230 [Methylobacterium sp. NEAU 140]|uniref:hypothetical protein n=1 Tax=Methylobacterium sp. NEAU 140 TaxID=3064945 RepID=UPI0027373D7F|nr:hypothetical protein [Methylobacterium sp. NEAU 140]MDP4026321.1 hypothetical protein [Methylobacterium sp. NEAU 140]